MIICYEGLPGSGKSYEAVKKIAATLRQGRTIYTNIDGLADDDLQGDDHRECLRFYCDMSEDQFKRQFQPMSNEKAKNFWEFVKPGALIVVDEVHKLWDNRSWQSTSNRAFNEWCSTHRHEGYDLILITQSIEKIDSHVRSMIQWTYRFKKIDYFGGMVSKRYRMKVYQEVQVDKDPISTKHMVYSDEIFKLYKSYAASDIKEQKIAQTTNILRHPIFLVIPVMIAFTIYMFCKSSLAHGDMWGTKKLQAASAAKAQAASVEPPRKDGYFLNGKWVSTAVPATKTPGAAVSDKAEETKKPDGPEEDVAKEESDGKDFSAAHREKSAQGFSAANGEKPYAYRKPATVEHLKGGDMFYDSESGRFIGYVRYTDE